MSNRILCVEDNELLGVYLKVLLTKREGFEIDVATSLAEALLSLRTVSTPYAAIVLDLQLPDSRGLGTLKAVNDRTASPIVVYSAMDGEDFTKTELMEGGAYAAICKGVDHPSELVKALISAMASKIQPLEPTKSNIEKTIAGEAIIMPEMNMVLTNVGINMLVLVFVAYSLADIFDKLTRHQPPIPADWIMAVLTAGLGLRAVVPLVKR